MRRALPLFFPIALFAQQPQSLEAQRFMRDLRQSPSGTLVFLEDEKGEWLNAVRALSQEDGLVEFELHWWSIHLKKEATVAAYTCARFGWEPGPHWAYVDAKGEILFQGHEVPTLQVLKDGLAQAGVQSTLQVLRAFVHRNPDHLEGRFLLLERCLRLANVRTQRAFAGKGVLRKPPKPEGSEEAIPEKAIQLEPEQDAKIWEESCALMERLFAGDDWMADSQLRWIWPISSARSSTLMGGVLHKAMPVVEAQLQRLPSDWRIWQIWLHLAEALGGRPLAPLLASLVPPPTLRRDEWPPEAVVSSYVREARGRKAWREIQDVLSPRWDSERLQERRVKYLRIEDGKPPTDDGLGWRWSSLVEPLLEALLRQGQTAEADRIVDDAVGRMGFTDLAGKAGELALRCKYPDLAVRWKALGTPRR